MWHLIGKSMKAIFLLFLHCVLFPSKNVRHYTKSLYWAVPIKALQDLPITQSLSHWEVWACWCWSKIKMEDWKFGGHQTLRLEKKSGKYHQPILITNERNILRTYVFCSDMIALPLKIFFGRGWSLFKCKIFVVDFILKEHYSILN